VAARPINLKIKIFGDEVMRRKLLRGAAVAANPKPALELIADDMMRVIDATFTGQGRRYGGSWAALDPKYVEKKSRAGLDPRILIASGDLRRSMTVRGDENQYLKVDHTGIELESELEYAARQQFGGDGIPARPFIAFYPQDRARWVRIIEDELRSAMTGD